MNKLITAILLTILLNHCGDGDGIDYFPRYYKPPYFAINLNSGTPVYIKPGDKEKPIYYLEENRIVQMNGSISLKKPEPIWYFIQESNVHGYSLSHNFKLFETRKDAETFLLKKFTKDDASPALSIYNRAEADYQKGDFANSTVKLFRFLKVSGAEDKKDSLVYLNTNLLIAKIYIKGKDFQKAISHLKGFEVVVEKTKKTKLLGLHFYSKRIAFNLEALQQLFNKTDYPFYNANILTELNLLKARAYQGLKKYKKADYIYRSIIEDKTADILYKKDAMDRIAINKNSVDRIYQLEKILGKLELKGDMRYLIFKLGSLYENAYNESEKIAYKKKAVDYYRQFSQIYENQSQSHSFPGEQELYDIAVQQMDYLK